MVTSGSAERVNFKTYNVTEGARRIPTTTSPTMPRYASTNRNRKGLEFSRGEFFTSSLIMADENETAPSQEKEVELEEDHGHCSDCENEEHHFDDG